MSDNMEINQAVMKPEIMAPAGNAQCFLAALAAGADGIYAGLKNFSARMQAQNFGLGELARLTTLAHKSGCKVYITMNTILKQTEIIHAYRLLMRLEKQVRPDGLIIQDLAMAYLARQTGYGGELIYSTLANISTPKSLLTVRKLGGTRVVMPRELSIDEMKQMGENCPPGLGLECFIHGALCYCVSGRCYWSSYLGGYSGLRGRCVQPCRRNYTPADNAEAHAKRFFACQDLELAPVVKALLTVANLESWKIEGRKKGPHYVYHTVAAYKILRDNFRDTTQKKMAFEILEMALGRPGIKARFLPQRINRPMNPDGQTSSGKLAAKVNILQNGECIIRPHFPLLANDLLRIGVQDEKWHAIIKVKHSIPKGAKFILPVPRHKTPKAGTPVFLVDRRERELERILTEWQKKLMEIPEIHIMDAESQPVFGHCACRGAYIPDMELNEDYMSGKWKPMRELANKAIQAIWLNKTNIHSAGSRLASTALWLPPAIWPENEGEMEKLIHEAIKRGASVFVLNATWQRSLFPEKSGQKLRLVAGPFCNIANSLACEELIRLGFAGAFISPELAEKDYMQIPASTSLPLGIILGGFWPVGVSRFGLAGISAGGSFASPYGERFFTKGRYNMIWIYPAWPMNLAEKKTELQKAGYKFFCWLNERLPHGINVQKRPGLYNWNGKCL